jgi:hypothetical protein
MSGQFSGAKWIVKNKKPANRRVLVVHIELTRRMGRDNNYNVL